MIAYTVVRKFNATRQPAWDLFKASTGIEHASEVVTLDQDLCPPRQTDGEFHDCPDPQCFARQNPDLYADVVHDPGALLTMVRDTDSHVVAFQTSQSETISGFTFRGVDLLDLDARISVLVNCGRLEKAFSPNQVNTFGLVPSWDEATNMRRKLQANYPDLSHNSPVLVGLWTLA